MENMLQKKYKNFLKKRKIGKKIKKICFTFAICFHFNKKNDMYIRKKK